MTLAALLALAVSLAYSASALAAAPHAELQGDAQLESRAGSTALTWQVAPAAKEPTLTYELQQAMDSGFADARTLYSGPDQGRFISGMENGTYYYRVRARSAELAWGPWSQPQVLRVEHWAASRALGLMALGAVVFCATAFVVLRGAPDDDLTDSKA